MDKIIFVCCALFLLSTCSYAQIATRKDSVTIMKVVNPDIFKILDDIIDHEKKCDYYSEDLVFSIRITYYDIEISTVGKQKYSLGGEYGLFFHKNHIFFISGKQDENLFTSTIYKLAYEFDVSTDYTDPVTGKTYLYIYENTNYSMWIYNYKDKKFNLEEVYTRCGE